MSAAVARAMLAAQERRRIRQPSLGVGLTLLRARIADHVFAIEAPAARAPKTIELLRGVLPLRVEAIHAMWSGPLILVHIPGVSEIAVENPITFLKAGDVVYHPAHFELGIAYDTTQFREPVGSVYVSRIGQVSAGLDPIVALGKRLQRLGAQAFQIDFDNGTA